MSKNHINNSKDNNSDFLLVRGAEEHNLKQVDLDLKKNQLVVFSGVSGSGKSSLAFDTIYTEGQRRYVESLSNYTKQFLGVMKKPKVDSIEGLSPAISIEQKTSSSNPRSTVGTVTEIFDFVRMLFARVGQQFCYKCGSEVSSQSLDEILDNIIKIVPDKGKFLVIAPYIRNQRGDLKNAFDFLKSSGFHRILLDDQELTLDEDIRVDKKKKHKLFVVVDRLKMKPDIRNRLAESVEVTLSLAEGNLIIKSLDEDKEYLFSEHNYCQACHLSFPDLSPNSFSFNTPAGMCSKCHGLGVLKSVDINKLVKYPGRSIKGGAIPFVASHTYNYKTIVTLLESLGVNESTKFKDMSLNVQNILLYGTKKSIELNYKSKSFKGVIKHKFEGIVNTIERRFKETSSSGARNYYESFMSDNSCDVCNGNRLRKESLSVKVNGKNINDFTALSISSLLEFIKELPNFLSDKQNFIAKELRKEMLERLSFLVNVGLKYLTLNRPAKTLSGGEAQRIRLASQIGSGLTGVIYVLDEPSIGLHQKDNQRLLDNLLKLRDKGNSVLVVEHDRETIEAADTIVDFGPNAGIYGGEVVYNGNFADFNKAKSSHTSDYIFRRKNVQISFANKHSQGRIVLEGVKTNNLKDINVYFPLNKISIVTGVSGAGKSSLVMDTLYPALQQIAKNREELEDSLCNNDKYEFSKIFFENYQGEQIADIQPRLIKIDQSPIGRTPRSNPVTYIGAFDLIREVMAQTKLSKMRGYSKGRFSFNVKGGRCEKCSGSGVVKVEMHFLADVYVECDVCNGKRYNSETLEVKYKDKNINEILNLDIQEAYEFFKNIPKLEKKLKTLIDVGMGYIKLGQSSNTLSGGEAQRIKLAKELSKTLKDRTIYILDEPTTGLHFYDIQHLLNVLQELREAGGTIVIIEHNLDMIANADHLIDLGPDGGPDGGEVVYCGTMKDIIGTPNSYTAIELEKELRLRTTL